MWRWGQIVKNTKACKIEFNSFASNMIKLSVNETKWSSLLASTRALIPYISIWIFDFGPKKFSETFEKLAPGSPDYESDPLTTRSRCLLDCKTVRIFAYSSTREQSNEAENRPYGRVRLARFARVRLLRHALSISLLILRKKPDCFAV